MSVEAWLRQLGLEQYATSFAANEVTADLLPTLTSDDLRALGVALVGHRRRILDAIAAFGFALPAAPSPLPRSAASAGLPHDPAPEPSAERRQVSVMFCDLVGSTALSARLDPEDLSVLIRAYQRQVNEIAGRHGGFIARYLGDGVLIYFGWPTAREDDPECAVRAALDIIAAIGRMPVRDERSRVRIGIATGLVVIGERIGADASLQTTAIGETPNRASRLQAIAGPDTVVIDAATRAMIGRLFDLRDIGGHEMPGLSGPIPAWAVSGESGMLSRFEALHGSSLTPFMGRDEELALLSRHWEQAKSGDGNVVLITGEPGIGKSRLVAAFDEHLRGQPHFRLRYFCSPHRRDTPLAPFIGQWEHAAGFIRGDTAAEKLAKLRGVLVPRTSPEDAALIASMMSLPTDDAMPKLELSAPRRKELTFAALARQFTSLACVQPVFVLAEDIHWSDPTSRELLDYLIDRFTRSPVQIVLTFRPEFEPPWVDHPGVTLLTLNRLSQRETAAMAHRLAASAIPRALIDLLVSRSDGVPLFIEELTRAVLEAGPRDGGPSSVRVPETLQASLLARLDRQPAAKAAAQIGSVIGRSFAQDMFAAITDLPDRTSGLGLDQLVLAGLLFRRGEPPDVTYQFKHALVQDIAYQSMLRPRRAGLHAAIVTVLEQDSEAAAADPALVAHHSAEAGLTSQAVRHFLAAGEQSAARGALAEARIHLMRGLKLAEDCPDIQDSLAWRTRYHVALGEVLGALRFYASPESGAVLAEAANLARGLSAGHPPHDALRARALFGYFVHQIYLGDFPAIRLLSDELLGLGQARGNPGIATLGGIANGICRVYQGELVAARAIFGDLLERWRGNDSPDIARALGLDPVSVLMAFGARMDALLGRPDTAVAAARMAVERARGLRHARSYAIALGTAWDTFAITGEEDDLRRATADWDALAVEQQFQFYLARARYCSGWLKVRDGDIAAGRHLIENSVLELEAVGVVLDGPQVHGMLADARAAAGDIAGALAAIGRGLEIAASSGGIWWNAELLLRKATFCPDEAECFFNEALTAARHVESPTQELRVATAFAAFLLERGRRREARAALARIFSTFTEGSQRADQRAAAALLARIDAPG